MIILGLPATSRRASQVTGKPQLNRRDRDMTVGETVGGYTRFQPEEFREGDTTTGNLWKSIYLGIYVYSVWWRGI